MRIQRDSRATYYITFAVLQLLLVVTVGISFLHLGAFNAAAALLVAFAKTTLIILFFMHLRHSGKLVWLAAFSGFFWLGILFVLGFSDYLSRGWPD